MKLLGQPLKVVNVGLDTFADPVPGATRVRWAPPAGGDVDAANALALLAADPRVEAANREAFGRYLEAEPVIEGIGIARDVIPNFGERMILHAGPPIAWARMGGPMKGAIVGAILLEGWAKDHAAAEALAASGEITFDSCHHHDAVGPMAGIICPSMPVWIVKNVKHGNRAFSGLNEGLGKVLRMGANSEEVLARLRWMRDTLAPTLEAVLAVTGTVELKPLMARALHMGDEVHNRNVAASSLLFKRFAPAMLRAKIDGDAAASSLDFINGNDHFFINVGMAACKSMLVPAGGVAGSSMVTVMARNGVEVGIRVSGTGDTWYTAKAEVPDGLFFAGYSRADGSPDIGDSAITETAGVGGFAMAAAPAIVQFVGGTPASALATSVEMSRITIGRNSAFTLPPLDFIGSPAGIDVRKVVDTGIQPVINTGIAHKAPGIGQIGAGVVRAPMACFAQGLKGLAAALGR